MLIITDAKIIRERGRESEEKKDKEKEEKKSSRWIYALSIDVFLVLVRCHLPLYPANVYAV